MQLRYKAGILICILFVSLLSAADLMIGFFAGGNEFKTEPQEYYGPPWFYSNYPDTNHLGHYYLDEGGRTFQLGVQMLINDHIGLRLEYRTPREGNSYSYSTDYPGYPCEENLPHVTVVKSHLTGISTEARYYLMPGKDLTFYAGIGVELATMHVDIHEINSTTYYYPWRSIPDHYFTRLGTKLLGGLILPFGMLINVNDHLSFDVGLNYTFMRMKQWDRVTNVPIDQNMGGLYL